MASFLRLCKVSRLSIRCMPCQTIHQGKQAPCERSTRNILSTRHERRVFLSPPPTNQPIEGRNAASISVPLHGNLLYLPVGTLVGRRLPNSACVRAGAAAPAAAAATADHHDLRPSTRGPEALGPVCVPLTSTLHPCCMGTAGPGPPHHTNIIERQLVSAVMDACMDEPPNESLTPISPGLPMLPLSRKTLVGDAHLRRENEILRLSVSLPTRLVL